MSTTEKKIPKSLKDCYVTDAVSYKLWYWSDWLEVWGGRVLIALIVIGIISIIAQAVQIADINEDLVFITVISSLVKWAIYVFIEYCAYNVLSLLIASLATIVQNTRITANVAIYNTAKEEGILPEDSEDPITNSGYSLTKRARPRTDSNGFWFCEECGTRNEAKALHCKDCGKYK